MMVMTAKVDIKKIAMILGVVVGVILVLILLLGGGNSDTATVAPTVSGNESRINFLKGFGWDVSASPVESSQVRIPQEMTQVFERYNALQKSQGYDLNQYAGKTVMRYVYKINNFPGAAEPVYATVLVYQDQIIGGDITDTAAKGAVQGFRKTDVSPAPTQSTTPDTTAADAT